MSNTEKYIAKIKQITRKNLAAGTPDRIKSEVSALRKRSNIAKSAASDAKAIIKAETKQQEQEYINSRWSFNDYAASELTKAASDIEAKIVEAVADAQKNGLGTAETRKIIDRIGRTADRHVNTVADTVRAGVRRASSMNDAENSGCEWFRYMGPAAGARPFCAERLGRVYHISEIRAMSNGQGLPVEFYGGGYNCKHRWVAVSGEMDSSLFVNQSWQTRYNNASKQDKATYNKEKAAAATIAGFPGYKVELRDSSNEKGNDVDVFINGKAAELKEPTTFNAETLRNQLKSAKNQADNVYIVLNKEINDYNKATANAEMWLKKHSEKNCFVVNRTNHTIQRIKP